MQQQLLQSVKISNKAKYVKLFRVLNKVPQEDGIWGSENITPHIHNLFFNYTEFFSSLLECYLLLHHKNSVETVQLEFKEVSYGQNLQSAIMPRNKNRENKQGYVMLTDWNDYMVQVSLLPSL